MPASRFSKTFAESRTGWRHCRLTVRSTLAACESSVVRIQCQVILVLALDGDAENERSVRRLHPDALSKP